MDIQNPLLTIRRPEIIANPYPYYALLREQAPVVRDGTGAWIVSRYRDALEILTSPDASSQRLNPARRVRADADHPAIRELYEQLSLQVLFLDPPHHSRLRGLVSKAFTPTFVQRMRPAIQQTVDDLLANALSEGQLDVISQLAVPLPMRVICDMLNIPEADRADLKFWSSEYAEFLGGAPMLPHETMLRIASSMAEYMRYFRSLSKVRKANPGDDLLSALLRAETVDGRLERDAVCATAVLLITAGHETTTNLIGNGLLALLRQPEALEQLRRSPELWPGAVEELLRFDSPVQFIARKAGADIVIDEHRIEAEEIVFLMTGGANHDPRQFQRPERLDFARAKNRHLSFGQGPHYCIGAALARLEAQIALSTLIERTHGMGAIDAEPVWSPNPALRGLSRFPLAFEVARAA
jgi:cytochrome P450